MKIIIPATVPVYNKGEYIDNWRLATKKTGNLMLMAGDQKIEHLNDDFCGAKISTDDNNPEHLFKIAATAKIGVFAAQLGLIAAYGQTYKKIPYLIKLNSKTDLNKGEPISKLLTTIDQVVTFKKHSKLKVVGVGMTIYPGSENEAEMLSTAGQMITSAHQAGLISVLWIYPRGQAVNNEHDAHLIAGMAGLGAALGADFIKINYPKPVNKSKLKEIINAAGRSGVIFSGGVATDELSFLKTLEEQLEAGARGNATGRNIHQHELSKAIKFCNAISAVSLDGASADEAYKIFKDKK